jgi:hypothetical protein
MPIGDPPQHNTPSGWYEATGFKAKADPLLHPPLLGGQLPVKVADKLGLSPRRYCKVCAKMLPVGARRPICLECRMVVSHLAITGALNSPAPIDRELIITQAAAATGLTPVQAQQILEDVKEQEREKREDLVREIDEIMKDL